LFTDDQEITVTGSTLTGIRYYGTSAMRNGTTDLWYLATNDQGSDTTAVQVATGTVTQKLYDPWESREAPTANPQATAASSTSRPTRPASPTFGWLVNAPLTPTAPKFSKGCVRPASRRCRS
jgi:hypothetical protein